MYDWRYLDSVFYECPSDSIRGKRGRPMKIIPPVGLLDIQSVASCEGAQVKAHER